ncbi:MAG: Methyltransferase type 12 [Bacteriovoracaceae bacterium]|nr:Methyltransferase type 12 [Bacteriovoracaceae bacterium]
MAAEENKKVFEAYATYYNLVYQDKNYEEEARFTFDILERHSSLGQLLELGCGTGRHAFHLADLRLRILGVDFSKDMLMQANELLSKASPKIQDLVRFEHGDIRSFRTKQTFDSIVSLFHVMSYQTTNQDLEKSFETARTHLKKGGIFLFDCWYGPAVLTEKPSVRVRNLENEIIKVTRIAEPHLDENKNTVEVNYTLFIENKKTNLVTELHEKHLMRYLFLPEIEAFAKAAGFEIIESKEWLKDAPPSTKTWGVYFACRA